MSSIVAEDRRATPQQERASPCETRQLCELGRLFYVVSPAERAHAPPSLTLCITTIRTSPSRSYLVLSRRVVRPVQPASAPPPFSSGSYPSLFQFYILSSALRHHLSNTGRVNWEDRVRAGVIVRLRDARMAGAPIPCVPREYARFARKEADTQAHALRLPAVLLSRPHATHKLTWLRHTTPNCSGKGLSVRVQSIR